MYGAGEPHRGWVNSYTRRVTAPNRQDGWEGGTTQMVRYEVGGIGCLVRYPVCAVIGSGSGCGCGGGGVRKSQGSTQYTFNTKKNVITKTSKPGDETAIDRSRFVHIKVVSQHQYTVGRVDLEDLYLRLALTQTDQCLIAPHHSGDFNQRDYPPQMVNIQDPVFDKARAVMDPLLKQAIGVWKNMVNITRKLGRNVSFVGNEDGSIQVLRMKRGPYEHVGLSEIAVGMLSDAARESFPSMVDVGREKG
jgi:hypothetical protein